jgi:argininosuccinate lyase
MSSRGEGAGGNREVPLEGARVTLWAGRVAGSLAPEVWELVRAADAELFPYDVEGTRLHARRLAVAGIIGADELAEVEERLSSLDPSMIEETDEDVHSAIEQLLGPIGRKIHAGRSRNDQVVTAFRLWTLDACADATAGIEALAAALLDRAEEHAETLMPGYTHLQRAQPVTLGHHLLAWVEMLARDRDRFALAASHAEPIPLGAGALAGTTLALPKVRNSLDAVADRDFALDYLYAAAALFVHLSRIGEELALWATAEFGFVRLPESAATGSSMMPQKLNPDVAELARGKAGTAIGRLAGLLATVKGLPLSYNSDLGEDKPAAFAARADVQRVLAALTVLIRDLVFVEDRLEEAARDRVLLATDAAEALVAEGVPFRDAHEEVARAVREGSFDPETTAAESVAARLDDVRAAVVAARARFQVQ